MNPGKYIVTAIYEGYDVGNKVVGKSVLLTDDLSMKFKDGSKLSLIHISNITNPNCGDNVTYTVTVTNDGIGDAKDVVVRDVLGEGLKFVSAIGEYTWDEDSRCLLYTSRCV